MFLKIPKDSDVSLSNYRCRKDVGNFIYIEYINGYIDSNWTQIEYEDVLLVAPEWFENTIEYTQMDRIEHAVLISNDELRQEGADNLVEELINSGIL